MSIINDITVDLPDVNIIEEDPYISPPEHIIKRNREAITSRPINWNAIALAFLKDHMYLLVAEDDETGEFLGFQDNRNKSWWAPLYKWLTSYEKHVDNRITTEKDINKLIEALGQYCLGFTIQRINIKPEYGFLLIGDGFLPKYREGSSIF